MRNSIRGRERKKKIQFREHYVSRRSSSTTDLTTKRWKYSNWMEGKKKKQ